MAHPYMANSIGDLREKMLEATGVASVDELFAQIPPAHRLSRPIELPEAITSEAMLARHLHDLLDRNESCEEALNFLGGGAFRHHVPAVCDEVVGRTEWLTSVWGTPSSDHGRFQAWFEYASQLGELLALDFVGLPVYSWGCAAGHALRMAARMTERRTVLVAEAIDPERRAVIANYCGSPQLERHLNMKVVPFDAHTGRTDESALASMLSAEVAAVYIEHPNYLGVLEEHVPEFVAIANRVGAEVVLGVDPISLGVLAPPGELGVGLSVGTVQTLGVHLNAGGGVGGFIASRDEERYAREYPTLQVSICDTDERGERGFGITLFEQTSYGAREEGNDWTGNSVYMWAIAAATYMAVMGPQGFREVDEAILQRSHYAAQRLAELPGVAVRYRSGFFREIVVDFCATGHRVAELNAALQRQGIFGGVDLSHRFPVLGESALYCVTELHTMADIDRLVDALAEAIR